VAAKPGTLVTVKVSPDPTVVRDRLAKLVSDYNTAASTMASLRAYDPATRKGGPLIGDGLLLNIESRLRRDVSAAVATPVGAPTTLSAIGVTMGADGKLSLNEGKLNIALQSDPSGVAKLLAGEGGIAKRLAATLDGAIAAGGQVGTRTDSLQSQKRDLQKQRDALELRMQSLEASYRAQFGALDALLSDMQSTGKYLAAQLT
jgi:flagellar hook-associated protein 2